LFGRRSTVSCEQSIVLKYSLLKQKTSIAHVQPTKQLQTPQNQNVTHNGISRDLLFYSATVGGV